MIQMQGVSISPGYASGVAVVYDFEIGTKLEASSREVLPEDVLQEWERLEGALQQSRQEMLDLTTTVATSKLLGKSANILAAHTTLTLELATLVKQYVGKELVNAECAVEAVVSEWVTRLHRVNSEYLRQREQDVRDVGRRISRHLAGTLPWDKGPFPADSIVVARELLPSEVVELAHCGVRGIVTERGGRFGHAAILAKAHGIPVVTRILHATSLIRPGAELLVNAESGVVTVTPAEAQKFAFVTEEKNYQEELEAEQSWQDDICATNDGVEIILRANISNLKELPAVEGANLMGVGLFRTESIFLDASERPDTRLQLQVYQDVVASLQGEPLVIRTFDLGGDTLPPFLLNEESHSSHCLQRRGLQFSLLERELLDSQLQAILKVAQEADVSILFPMVLGSHDLGQAFARVDHVLDQFGFINAPPLGAMIETPAALFALDEILDLADFVAIGTNDLTQFMLGTDRATFESEEDFSAMHPLVLRAIQKIVDAANTQQCPLFVCGEEASNPDFAILLIGLGVRELSINPASALPLRKAIHRVTLQEAVDVAHRALFCSRQQEVRSLLRKLGI